ncbi:MAG: hypothetical protein IJ371_06525 [Clostridia bacterium]|nr:hypothetical protein [Clostridia bacterium]
MIRKDLKKLKKEKTPKQIIYLHCHNEIYLTSKQLTEIIELKNKEER